jgi:iron complex transport system substrate-binding protein
MKRPFAAPLARAPGPDSWRPGRRTHCLRTGFTALVMALGFLLGWPTPALAEIQVTDDRGHAVVLARPPMRIVSLLPSLTEAVCELQACRRLVGTDRFSNWPEHVKALPKLGGLEDAQLERIVALRPDLVLAGASSRAIARLEALGIPVLALEARSLDDTRRMLETVAQALGMPGTGTALWQRIDARISAAAQRVPPGLRGRKVYFEVASAPYAAGESSFVGETLGRLGLGNIVPAALGPFPQLNPEYVLRAQPDVVMAADHELATMRKRPGWKDLRALRRHRQCGFTSARYDVLVRPGPRLGEAAEIMADCLAAMGDKDPA